MFCSKCGNQVPDDSKFCPLCGAAVGDTVATETAQAQTEQPAPQPVYTYDTTPVNEPNNLVWGILSLAFCGQGIVGGILGIVFGKKAKKLAKEYSEATGMPPSGKVKAGNILGKIGFAVGIAGIIFYAIYYIFCFSLGLIGGLSGGFEEALENVFDMAIHFIH